MTGIVRANKQLIQRGGNDSLYGTGLDGNGYINSTVTLTSDMYYNNLEVTSNGILLTNGFKVFVKNTLTLNGHIGVGSVSSGTVGESASVVPDGTLAGQATSTISYRLGGQGGGGSFPNVSTLPSYLYKNINNLLGGSYIDSSNTGGVKIGGGSAGTTGTTGATTPAPTTWPNKTGKAGANGGYAPSATTVNAPGGKGNPAADGGANSGPAPGGAGGSGGAGGGVVAVFAKTIVGSGKLFSLGRSGTAGSPGTTIPAGTPGANGTKAPDRTDHFHVAPGHAHEPHVRNHDHHNHTTKHSDRHGHKVAPHGSIKGHHYEGPHWHHGGHYHHPHNDGPHGGVHHWDGHYWHAWKPHESTGHWTHYPPHGHQKPNGHHNWYQPDGNAHHHERFYHGSFGGHDGHVHAHFGEPPHTHTHVNGITHGGPRYHHHHTGPASHRSHANPPSYNPAHHYVGGAGGVNDASHGVGAPAITGATGKRGGAGGGGAIVVVCDTISNNILFDVRQGLIDAADNVIATPGSSYIIYNI